MVNGIGGPGGSGKIGGAAAGGAPIAPQAPAADRKGFGEAIGAAEKADATQQATPLERLRSGEIQHADYVELRVHEATAHLAGALSPADLEALRAELREVVEADPDVAALAQAARLGS